MNVELIDKAAQCLAGSKYAIALTGAGVSTESGIQDFRGPNGLWTKNPDAERIAYEMYFTFMKDAAEYWKKRLTQPYMGDMSKYLPNPGHMALSEMEKDGILKCLITQNIDGLHELAGNVNLIEYHGSVKKLRCPACGRRYNHREYDLMAMLEAGTLPPICAGCNTPMKDDVVHFNEPIPDDVAQRSLEEVDKCDAMLICGTSAVVYPFANLPRLARQNKSSTVTIIEINAAPTPLTGYISDFIILGRTAEVLPKISESVKKIKNTL
jgi:NAD-dependent deacetylase